MSTTAVATTPPPTCTTTSASLSQQQPATTPVAIINKKDRSAQEIARLVQRRVSERDRWLVDGEPQEKTSHVKDLSRFVWDVAPKYLRLQTPSQAFLDEHFPVRTPDWKRLQNPPSAGIQMTWMGHASVLIQMNGCTILTDPVFSQRCAPTQWNGPKRIRPPPCTIAELHDNSVFLDVVLISHNHYDHLDCTTVRDIHKSSPATSFVVPLGLKSWCRDNLSPNVIVHELDWHEYVDYNYNNNNNNSEYSSSSNSGGISSNDRQSLRITSVPMRHWSSRVGADRDKTLWCGYSLATQPSSSSSKPPGTTTKQQKVLFPGDTAWFDGLEDLVGKPYGPFDVAAIPIGAYQPREFMKKHHINVDEAVRMKDAIQARHAVPIHWGTFPLTVEPFLEPQERLQALMHDRDDDAGSFDPWLIGQTKVF